MNKILATTLTIGFLSVSSSLFAGSTINLAVPANNQIAPSSSMEIDLKPLMTDVPYMVSCHVNSTSTAQHDIDVSPRLAPNGGFGINKINGKPMVKNVGALLSGDNTLTFMASVSGKNKDAKNAAVVKNLDTRYAATVSNCEATPVSNANTKNNKFAGGYFYVINRLPYFMDIQVGNFFPVFYCIYPYTQQYIETTSGYQDVDVITIHS